MKPLVLLSILSISISNYACSTHTKIDAPLEGPLPTSTPSPSAKPNPQPTDPASSIKSPLEGTWKAICQNHLSLTVTFYGEEYISDGTLYNEADCLTVLSRKTEKGRFQIGDILDASQRIRAIDTEYYNSTGTLTRKYDIFQLNDRGELRFGIKPGQTPAARPTALRMELYLRKD